VNTARRRAWAGIEARHGAIPGIHVADKVLDGVTCIRLDASVVACHSGKEGAEPNFKGFGLHPLGAWCDNTAEPLAGMLRPGSAGSNTTAGHLTILDAAIGALPPKYRRRLMVTTDGAGASHGLITRLDKLAARPGHQLTYSAGWELGQREKTAITAVPRDAWQIAVDERGEVRERRAEGACAGLRCAHRGCWIEEACVAELTPLLRGGRAGDQLAAWPASMRVFARRERPRPGAQLTLFEAGDGWRYTLWVTNLPAAARLTRGGRQRELKISATWPWPLTSPPPGNASAPCRKRHDQRQATPAIKEGAPGPWNPGHPARQPGRRHTRTPGTRFISRPPAHARHGRHRRESSKLGHQV
jgi:hypothetical protein